MNPKSQKKSVSEDRRIPCTSIEKIRSRASIIPLASPKLIQTCDLTQLELYGHSRQLAFDFGRTRKPVGVERGCRITPYRVYYSKALQFALHYRRTAPDYGQNYNSFYLFIGDSV
jgi:hypothetical protein